MKHGIDFRTAAGIFCEEYKIIKSPFESEERWLATGIVKGRPLTVVFTIREGRCRIISARKARKNEQKNE